jgi:hypothetical protein
MSRGTLTLLVDFSVLFVPSSDLKVDDEQTGGWGSD